MSKVDEILRDIVLGDIVLEGRKKIIVDYDKAKSELRKLIWDKTKSHTVEVNKRIFVDVNDVLELFK